MVAQQDVAHRAVGGHANAFQCEGGCVAVAGPSGSRSFLVASHLVHALLVHVADGNLGDALTGFKVVAHGEVDGRKRMAEGQRHLWCIVSALILRDGRCGHHEVVLGLVVGVGRKADGGHCALNGVYADAVGSVRHRENGVETGVGLFARPAEGLLGRSALVEDDVWNPYVGTAHCSCRFGAVGRNGEVVVNGGGQPGSRLAFLFGRVNGGYRALYKHQPVGHCPLCGQCTMYKVGFFQALCGQ